MMMTETKTQRSSTIPAQTVERGLKCTMPVTWAYPFKQAYTPKVRVGLPTANNESTVYVDIEVDHLLALADQVRADLKRSTDQWER